MLEPATTAPLNAPSGLATAELAQRTRIRALAPVTARALTCAASISSADPRAGAVGGKHGGTRLLLQSGAAVPAVGRATAVNRAARPAGALDTRLGACQKPLHLTQLGIGLLQLGRPAGDHVQAIVIANRHLIRQPSQIPCERRDTLGELQAAAAQLRNRAAQDSRVAGWQDEGRGCLRAVLVV